jgi:hypothetical protein
VPAEDGAVVALVVDVAEAQVDVPHIAAVLKTWAHPLPVPDDWMGTGDTSLGNNPTGGLMPAGNNEKNKTAAALYEQLEKELEELVSSDDQGYRLQELERIARIYALVAEAPVIRTSP